MKLSAAIQKLEEYVSELEHEDTDIDKAITLYKKALKLAKEIQEDLQKTELTVKTLLADGQSVTGVDS